MTLRRLLGKPAKTNWMQRASQRWHETLVTAFDSIWRIRRSIVNPPIKTIQLPLHRSPPYQTYLSPTYPLSILQAHTDTTNLLAAYYINFAIPKSKAQAVLGGGASIAPWLAAHDLAQLGFFEEEEWSFDLPRRPPKSATSWLLDKLSGGWYVCANVNEFYVAGTSSYRKQSRRHSALFFGYDAKMASVSVMSYCSNGVYGAAGLALADIEPALHSYGATFRRQASHARLLYAVRPRPEPISFDASVAISHLRDYLASESRTVVRSEDVSRKITGREWRVPIPPYERIFGLEAMAMYEPYIATSIANRTPIDLRDTRSLWEHKRIQRMNIRRWAAACGCDATNWQASYEPVLNWAHGMHLLAVDYNASRGMNYETLAMHIRRAKECAKVEEEVLKGLHSKLLMIKQTNTARYP